MTAEAEELELHVEEIHIDCPRWPVSPGSRGSESYELRRKGFWSRGYGYATAFVLLLWCRPQLDTMGYLYLYQLCTIRLQYTTSCLHVTWFRIHCLLAHCHSLLPRFKTDRLLRALRVIRIQDRRFSQSGHQEIAEPQMLLHLASASFLYTLRYKVWNDVMLAPLYMTEAFALAKYSNIDLWFANR